MRACIYQYFENNHPVLKLSDIRRIDLEEDLIHYQDYYCRKYAADRHKTITYYAGLTSDLFKYYLPCIAGSRVDHYKLRALELMSELKSSKDDDASKILDFFSIYLALMREASKTDFHKESIADLDMSFSQDDEVLLKTIRDYRFEFPLLPNGTDKVEIPLPKVTIHGVKLPKMQPVKIATVRTQSEHEKVFLYIHSILLLEICLDEDDAYVPKENENA